MSFRTTVYLMKAILKRLKNTCIVLIVIFLCLFPAFSFQPSKILDTAEPSVNWLTFSQLNDSMRLRPKRVFVKIYTDWCGPCKLMDKKTLSKARIIEPLSKFYYSVAFNAEKTDSILFKDSLFQFNPNLGRGIHNLAVHLGKENGTVSYPTILILDENLNVIYRYPAFMSVPNLEEVLYLYKDIQK